MKIIKHGKKFDKKQKTSSRISSVKAVDASSP